MSRVGTYGISVYVGTDSSFCLGQNTIVISPKKNQGRLLFTALRDDYTLAQIEEQVTGSTQKTISLKSIRALKYPLPPNDWEPIKYLNLLLEGTFHLGVGLSRETEMLDELNTLFLSKMTKVEVNTEKEMIY
jgi:hypothetical protein